MSEKKDKIDEVSKEELFNLIRLLWEMQDSFYVKPLYDRSEYNKIMNDRCTDESYKSLLRLGEPVFQKIRGKLNI